MRLHLRWHGWKPPLPVDLGPETMTMFRKAHAARAAREAVRLWPTVMLLHDLLGGRTHDEENPVHTCRVGAR